VRAEAVLHRLDQRRTGALDRPVPRLLDGGTHHPVGGQRVHPVDLDAVEPVGRRLLCERRGAGLALARDGDGPLVVVADEHRRHVEHPGEVQPLVEVTLRRCAVADVTRDDGVVAAQFRGPRHPRRVGHLRPDGDVDGEGGALGEPAVPLLVAHPVQQVLRCQSTHRDGSVLAVLVAQPVLAIEGVGTADLCALLTRQRRVGAGPPLALEADRPLVEPAGKPHLLVHRQQFLVVDVRNRRARDDAAIGVEHAHPIVRRAVEDVRRRHAMAIGHRAHKRTAHAPSRWLIRVTRRCSRSNTTAEMSVVEDSRTMRSFSWGSGPIRRPPHICVVHPSRHIRPPGSDTEAPNPRV